MVELSAKVGDVAALEFLSFLDGRKDISLLQIFLDTVLVLFAVYVIMKRPQKAEKPLTPKVSLYLYQRT
jgi:hypothetical protein